MYISSALVPWTCEWKNTGWNADGNGKSYFLDRHSLACEEGKAINYFHLERNGGKYRYKYRCCDTQSQCKNKLEKTPFTSDGNGNTIFLDRQNIDCNKQFLSSFRMQRNGGGNRLRYSFTCCEMPAKERTTCDNFNTPMNDDGGGNAIFLDRHEVTCGDNSALSHFKLVRGGNKYQYQYTCCRTNKPVATTPAPYVSGGTTSLPSSGSTGSNDIILNLF